MEFQLEEYLELIEDHAKVAFSKIRKPTLTTSQDLVQEGAIVFLFAKKNYSNKKKTSFKTFLTRLLRNCYSDIVKKSYQKQNQNLLYKNHTFTERRIKHLRNILDPIENAQATFLLEILTLEESEYIKTMLLLQEESYRTRRKRARETLGISYGKETKLRNSIKSKIRK